MKRITILLVMCLCVLPLMGCATGYSSAGREIGRVDVPPTKIATDNAGAVLFDKDGIALTEHKDQVVWRFRETARDDDPLEHWSTSMFKALETVASAIASFETDVWVGPAMLFASNMTLPAIFDTAVADYGVASDIEIRAHGDDLRAVITKSMNNSVESSDLVQDSGKAVTDLKNGPFITAAFFGQFSEADRQFIRDIFALDLKKTKEPESPEATNE